MTQWHPLTPSTHLVGNPELLLKQLDEDGYLYLPGLLPAEDVLKVRADVTSALQAAGWLSPDHDADAAVPGPGARRESAKGSPEYFVGYEAIQRQQSFHELAHHARILEVTGQLLQDDVLVHPRKIARAGLPGDQRLATPPHQDFRLIQGTGDVLTVWLPLGDCPHDLGGLTVLAGSHRLGLLPVQTVEGVGGVRVDIDLDPTDPRWQASPMGPGDVLLFHSLTVHGAKPNLTQTMRLSCDFRYQSVREPVVQGSLGVHWSPPLPGYDVLTQGWTSTASVEAPDGVVVAPGLDLFDPEIPTPPSRLVTLPTTAA